MPKDEIYYSDYPDNEDYPYVVNYSRPFHENEHYYFKTEWEACFFAEDLVNTSLMEDWKEVEASQYTTPEELYKNHDKPAICVEKMLDWNEENNNWDWPSVDIANYDFGDINPNKEYCVVDSYGGVHSIFSTEADAIEAAKGMVLEYRDTGIEETFSVVIAADVISQNFYSDPEYLETEQPIFECKTFETIYNIEANYIYENGLFAGDGSSAQMEECREDAEDIYEQWLELNEPWLTIAEEDCRNSEVTGAALRLSEAKFTVDPETGELEGYIEGKTLKEHIIWFKDVFSPLKRDIWGFPKTLDKYWTGYQYGQDYISYYWQQRLKDSIDAIQLWQDHGSGLYSVRWCGPESPYVAAQEALNAISPKYCYDCDDLRALINDWAAFAFKYNVGYWSDHIHDYCVECPLQFVEDVED